MNSVILDTEKERTACRYFVVYSGDAQIIHINGETVVKIKPGLNTPLLPILTTVRLITND